MADDRLKQRIVEILDDEFCLFDPDFDDKAKIIKRAVDRILEAIKEEREAHPV